jgi:RNA ligase
MKIPWPDHLPPISAFETHPGVRTIRDGNLRMFTYTEKQNFSGVWDDVTLNARSIIADDEGNLVAWPFPKFFNAGQAVAINGVEWTAPTKITNNTIIREKLDGSLIIAFWYAGQWRTVTRGSFHSEQAVAARSMVDFDKYDRGLTILSELIGPGNRHVIEYPEDRLVPLAYRMDSSPNLRFDHAGQTDWITGTKDTAEGFVAIHPDGTMVKHKTDYYLTSLKSIRFLSDLPKAWAAGTHIDIIAKLPPWYAAAAREATDAMDRDFLRTLEHAMDTVLWTRDRKEFAQWVAQSGHDRALMFAIADYRAVGTERHPFSHVTREVRKIVASRALPLAFPNDLG